MKPVDQALRLFARLLPENSPVGRALRSFYRRLFRPVRPSPVRRILAEFARVHPRAVFIQIGANDGVKLDPLRPFIPTTHWRGVMVEPVPYVFDRLRKNYGDVDRIALENVAIADRNDPLPFYYLAPPSENEDVPRLYDAIGSFRRDVLLKHKDRIPDIEQRMICVQIPCMTFEALCTKHGIDSVDLIQMDTEGYDFEIIKQIDLARYRPTLVMFERHHLTSDEQAACRKLFRQAGYDTLDMGLDTLALNISGRMKVDPRLLRIWSEMATELRAAA